MAGASEVDVATAEEIILASEELDRLVSELHHRESFRAADVHKLVLQCREEQGGRVGATG